MLMITIVEELECQRTSPTALSYFFCQGTNENLNTAAAVLRGLIYMLCDQQPLLASHLRARYDYAGAKLFQDTNSFYALSEVLVNILHDERLQRAYLMVDALDECIADQDQLLRFIVTRRMPSPRVKWIVSSRNVPKIEDLLTIDSPNGCPGSDIRLSLESTQNADKVAVAIKAFINHKLSTFKSLQEDYKTRQQLRNMMYGKANGTFLWASLIIPELEKLDSREITDAMSRDDASKFSGLLAAQALTTTSAKQREITRLDHHQNHVELLDWIGNPKDTSGPVLTPFPGTGEWFLKSDAYQNWVSGNGPSLLWCHGPPGVGTSVLASVALQNLTETLEAEPVCLLYYFCDFANRKEQKKEAIWKCLLRQVIAQNPAPALQALTCSRGRLGSIRPASSRELSDAFGTVCSSQQVVLVIDGLDELESAKDMKAILGSFVKANCRILVTSRDLPEIRSVLTIATILEVQADKGDLSTYVVGRFEENDLESLLESHPELETDIVDKSNGM